MEQRPPRERKRKEADVVTPPPLTAPAPLALVDGSQLEGGGQILRNASALACVLRVPLRGASSAAATQAVAHSPPPVHSIRAGRSQPGLRPQHLTGLNLLAELSGGSLAGGAVGSTDVTLTPAALRGGDCTADARTAGSVVLMVQSALPALLFAQSPSRLRLRGGTDAAMAPPVDYLRLVLLPLLRSALGVRAEVELVRRGFYPKGGGELLLSAQPLEAPLPPLLLEERGALLSVRVHAWCAGGRTQAQAQALADAAVSALDLPPDSPTPQLSVTRESAAVGDGAGLTLVAATSTGCLLGSAAVLERGAQAAEAGARAGRELRDAMRSGACVDVWAADQLMVFMALAAGESVMRAPHPLSLHARTAAAVAAQMTGARFEVRPCEGGRDCLVTCRGVGRARDAA